MNESEFDWVRSRIKRVGTSTRTCFDAFSWIFFFQSHLLINKRISSLKTLPANRERDFCQNLANGILNAFLATPSIELKKRICIVSISRHNPFGKLRKFRLRFPQKNSCISLFFINVSLFSFLVTCLDLDWIHPVYSVLRWRTLVHNLLGSAWFVLHLTCQDL